LTSLPLTLYLLSLLLSSSLKILSDCHQEKYNVEQAKALLRPGVYEEIRKQVDELLIMNLKKIQMQIAPKSKKKARKKKKSKKSKKDKKKRGLPGEKISELKGLDADQMLNMLIEHQIVVRVRERKLDSFIGDCNYCGSAHQNADRMQGM
jgi:IQ and AAA domain-containing protein